MFGGDLALPNKNPCHYLQLVFIDGACSNNGQDDAKAGLGITIGDDEEHCWSIAVEDAHAVDPDGPMTSQRAELLAAIEGLKKLGDVNRVKAINEALGKGGRPAWRHTDNPHSTYIVASDSEYVVKGITEWLPSWRVRLYQLTPQITH